MKEIKENERLYLELLNDTIKRMASNSASCKQWTIAIVTALLAIKVLSVNMAYFFWIAYIPIFFFYWLDSYYLHLEISFRNLQKKYLEDKENKYMVFGFEITKKDVTKGSWKKALSSPSTWPFYGVLALVVAFIWLLLTWGVFADFVEFATKP